MSHMLADDDDDNPNNDADMDYLQQIEAALQDAQADDDAQQQQQQQPPVNRRQRSAEDSDYDITRNTSDPQSGTNQRTTDASSTAGKPQQQRSRHLATGLVAHAHAKRQYTEVIEQLTKEDNKRNALLLKTLPEATAARYKYHLDVSFKTSAVRNLIAHLSGSNDNTAAPSRGRHTASAANLPPLFAQLMKTLVMHVTELARELQLADMRAGVVQRQAQVSAVDRQILGQYSNEVYQHEAAAAELEAVQQELQAVQQGLTDDAKMSESQEQPAAVQAAPPSSLPPTEAETVKANGDGHTGSAVKTEQVLAGQKAATNGSDAPPASATPAADDTPSKTQNVDEPPVTATADDNAPQTAPLLGQIPAYYIRAAYIQLQQQSMVPSNSTNLRRVKR